jgi:palmitoyltransferase
MDPGYIPLGRSFEKNAMPGLEFTTKDAFICDNNGKPRFCDHCNAYKPDRTHHCSEVGRCVKRMDHFCPWVGGIISENNMKFFLQFLVYGLFYNLFLVITLGILMQERKQKVSRELVERHHAFVFDDPMLTSGCIRRGIMKRPGLSP